MPDVTTIAITAVATLAVRWIWEKYLSKTSRVSTELCEQYRREITICLNSLKDGIEKRLDKGDDTFDKVSVCLSVSMHIILELCQEVGIDCKEIREKLIEKGVLK